MDSILLIGLGRFGMHIAQELDKLDAEVMAIDRSEERANDVLPYVTNVQIGDSTNVAFLESLGVKHFDVCIVAIGTDFQSSLETTSNLKELGAKRVISRASTDVQAKFLLRNGADEILYPDKQIAKWAAIRYVSNHIFDYIELDDSHAIYEMTVPDAWDGKGVGQIDIRKKYNINIVAIKKNGKISASVTPDTILSKESTILVLGEYKAIQKCFHI